MAGPSAHTVQAEVYLDYYDGEARKTLLIEMAGTGSSDSLVWDDDDGDPPFSTTAGELDERFLPDFELIRRWTPRSYENRQGKELMNLWRRR